MDVLKKCNQERINVELYMEKLLTMGVELAYGSSERQVLISDGIRLVHALMLKCYQEGILEGKVERARELKSYLSVIINKIDEQIIADTMKSGNDKDTLSAFEELLGHYGKTEEVAC